MSRALAKQTDNPAAMLLFHLTHVDNLPSILEHGGLWSLHALHEKGIMPRSIAFEHLQERREAVKIPVGPGGNLHDYVPWGFAARPPMLYTAARGGLPTAVKQDDILHLVTTVGRVQKAGLPFVFCDGHPLSAFSSFQDDPGVLPSRLDWGVLLSERWHNTEDDPDRKRRRQSEFLIHQVAPWPLLGAIAVRSEAASATVRQMLPAAAPVKIWLTPEWYYDL